MAVKILTIKEDILEANDAKSKANAEFLEKKGIMMVNIMSSPGAGKTTVILKTIEDMKDKIRMGVIEGDVASSVDADKINEQSVPVVQINTAGGCHLDANQIKHGLDNLPLDDIDLLLVENVGNLICTAEFTLGEQKRVMILSLPEGHDKPYKYPLMFTEVEVVLVSKMDLAPLLEFDLDEFSSAVKGLNEKAEIIPISAKTGEGMNAWYSWLEKQLKSRQNS
jgi:hydrogenase nickel incorporation protein HypB